MKRHPILLFMLVLIFILIPGCSRKTEEVSIDMPSESTRLLEQEQNDFSVEETGTDNDTKGVITDTVVDVFRDPDIKSERVTQAIFNQPAVILEDRENWVLVKVVDGYTGWIKSKYLDRNCSSIDENKYKYRIVVTGKEKKISSNPKGGITIKDVVMGTEFYIKNKVDGAYEVALPGNITGWITETGTIQLKLNEHIPHTTAADFGETALKFKGTSYLWGGVSSWGMDCSGLTYICSRINGIDLPRDADQQFEIGKEVPSGSMMKGDLVFFSTNTDLKDISHVGIYLGDNQFIHAGKGKGFVVVNSLNEKYYSSRIVGVKRIFSTDLKN